MCFEMLQHPALIRCVTIAFIAFHLKVVPARAKNPSKSPSIRQRCSPVTIETCKMSNIFRSTFFQCCMRCLDAFSKWSQFECVSGRLMNVFHWFNRRRSDVDLPLSSGLLARACYALNWSSQRRRIAPGKHFSLPTNIASQRRKQENFKISPTTCKLQATDRSIATVAYTSHLNWMCARVSKRRPNEFYSYSRRPHIHVRLIELSVISFMSDDKRRWFCHKNVRFHLRPLTN